jgi:protein tyrosine/serine phosphatase
MNSFSLASFISPSSAQFATVASQRFAVSVPQMKKFLATRVVPILLFAAGCGSVPTKASPADPAGNFSQVSDGVYRSGRPDEAGVTAWKNMGGVAIIDLEDDDAAIAAERGWAEAAGLKFYSHPMNGLDSPDNGEVDWILAQIGDTTNQPVLVHCMEGKDRTGLIIALYRVIYEGWTPQAAHDEMMAHGFNSILIAMNNFFESKTGWSD